MEWFNLDIQKEILKELLKTYPDANRTAFAFYNDPDSLTDTSLSFNEEKWLKFNKLATEEVLARNLFYLQEKAFVVDFFTQQMVSLPNYASGRITAAGIDWLESTH